MKKLRFAMAQMNPTVGDYSANEKKISAWIREAEKQKADMIVFPELALCGYPVWDLANRFDFVEEGLKALKRIVRLTKNRKITVVLGYIDFAWETTPEEKTAGGRDAAARQNRPLRTCNALAWIEKGRIKVKQAKRLLPTYDVFLEEIFFQSGKKSHVVPWKGRKVGATICEDLWDEGYANKPIEDLTGRGANLILNLSASPYYRGVSEVRDSLFKHHAASQKVPLLYVNQTGGQDDLIFDGRSLFVDECGRILFRGPLFEEGLFMVDWEPGRKDARSIGRDEMSEKPGEMYDALCLGVRDYCRKNGFRKMVIGLSGGIDSALVAAIAVDALGPKAVKGVTMPGTYSSRGSWEDSRDLAERLGIEFRVHPIKKKYESLVRMYHAQQKADGQKVPRKGQVTLAMENLQARLRGMELMYLCNDEGRLLLSTGNKSELAMGYCTLYGDMAGGLCVLGDVYKSDVYKLAWYRNLTGEVIPRSILEKAPSAELRPDQKDQDSLPPYDVLDEILFLYIEKHIGAESIAKVLKSRKVPVSMVREVIRKVDHNEYKRKQTPPILRVTEKAWFGRRMPITNRFKR